MELSYIRLLVNHFDECFRFYRDVMGFEVGWGEEGGNYADFRIGDSQTGLALFPRGFMASALGVSNLPASASMQDPFVLIIGVDDLPSVVEKLKSRGATFIAEIEPHQDWGIMTAHLRDPDGNLIEINSPLPTSEWSEDLQDEAKKEGERQTEREKAKKD